MKLTSEQTDAIERQTGAIPIPEDNPASESLTEVFGAHTFYADQEGLHVLEEVSLEDQEGNFVEVIKIAEWTTDEMNELQSVEPVRSGSVLDLDADPDDADGTDA